MRRAVGADLDDAGEQRQRLLHRRAAVRAHVAGPIAAGAQRAALGAHAVDQPSVEIAELDAEPALGEESFLRRGRLEARQIQNANIHRSHA